MTHDLPQPRFVVLRAAAPGITARTHRSLLSYQQPLPTTVADALHFAIDLGRVAPQPGEGYTLDLWELLASLAASDLGVARAIEPHLDALAILHQASEDNTDAATAATRSPRDSLLADAAAHTWGVFASEGGPSPVTARTINESDGSSGWVIDGTKLWCSLATDLDRALVTATLPGGERRLFAVDLAQPGVEVAEGEWHARGLSEIPSGPVAFTAVPATPVGDAGWYLTRPGFAWGGMGVAACWYGGAVGLARAVHNSARPTEKSPTADSFLLMHLGAIDTALQSARRALAEAAIAIDDGSADDAAGKLLSKRVRSTVARACETVLHHTAHALGPAPLARDAAHAKRVADLELYIRQHHAEKDDASLGSTLAESEESPW